MPAPLVEGTTSNAVSATSIALTTPKRSDGTALQSGDLIVAVIVLGTSPNPVQTGWTTIGTASGYRVFLRPAVVPEAASYSFDWDGATRIAIGGMFGVSGAKNPQEAVLSARNATASTTATVGSIDTLGFERLIITTGVFNGGSLTSSSTVTAPSGTTKFVERNSGAVSSTIFRLMALSRNTQLNPGATGTRTSTSSHSSDDQIATIISFEPVSKVVDKAVASSSISIFGYSRGINTTKLFLSKSVISLNKIVATLLSFINNHVFVVRKVTGKNIGFTGLNVFSMRKSISKQLTAISPQSLGLIVGQVFQKLISMLSSSSIFTTRSVGKKLLISSPTILRLTKRILKIIPSFNSNNVTQVKGIGKTIRSSSLSMFDLLTYGLNQVMIEIMGSNKFSITKHITNSISLSSVSNVFITKQINKLIDVKSIARVFMLIGDSYVVLIDFKNRSNLSIVKSFEKIIGIKSEQKIVGGTRRAVKHIKRLIGRIGI